MKTKSNGYDAGGKFHESFNSLFVASCWDFPYYSMAFFPLLFSSLLWRSAITVDDLLLLPWLWVSIRNIPFELLLNLLLVF
ncbi:hypothetical protein V2J09_015925 [Rumex salicifolius]